MYEWTLKTKVSGNFQLIKMDEIESPYPLHPGIKELVMVPFKDKDGKLSNQYLVEIKYQITTDDNQEAADVGRDVINAILDIFTFITGTPTYTTEQIVLNYIEPNNDKGRFVVFPEVKQIISSPIPIKYTDIFSIKINQKALKILSWYRKGLYEVNIINSTISFYIALELISHHFTCEDTITRTCENCGHSNEIKPGIKQRVEHLLINELEYTPEKFGYIWNEWRNKLFHGGMKLTSENKRDLFELRDELVVIIIKSVKKLFDIPDNEQPQPISRYTPISDSIVCGEYLIKPEHQPN